MKSPTYAKRLCLREALRHTGRWAGFTGRTELAQQVMVSSGIPLKSAPTVVLGIGCWLLDIGYWILAIGYF